MENNTPLEVIKVKPWTGPNNEIYTGKKTKFSLYDDRLEYVLLFTQKVTIEKFDKNGESLEREDSEGYCDEEGAITKDSITGISKYVETEYTSEGKPIKVHMLDLTYSGSILSFTTSTEEEKIKLYQSIYNWKFKK